MASILKLPLPSAGEGASCKLFGLLLEVGDVAGSEKIVVKKTFLEVEEDVTPQGTRYSILWSAYMGQQSMSD